MDLLERHCREGLGLIELTLDTIVEENARDEQWWKGFGSVVRIGSWRPNGTPGEVTWRLNDGAEKTVLIDGNQSYDVALKVRSPPKLIAHSSHTGRSIVKPLVAP